MNKLDDAIEFAIEKEAEMAAFYDQLGDRAETSVAKETFAELAQMERQHEELLEKFDLSLLPAEITGATPDLKIGDYLSDVQFTPDIGYRDIMVMAIKAEEKSRDMYREMASQYDPGTELRRLFDFLSEQESKHKFMLESEYDDNVMTDA